MAVSEQVAALRTARFFAEHSARTHVPAVIELLRRFGAVRLPLPGDGIDAAAHEGDVVPANPPPRRREP